MECWSGGVLECCKAMLPQLSPFITPFLQHSIIPILRMSWTRKHLLDIESLTAEEILTVLETARAFKAVGERAIKKVPALRGKTVVNAGDGAHEHPTQALLDTFTILERKGRVQGLKVTILGDILYSRVARSDIWALSKLGAKVTLCGPSTLVPRVFEEMGCRVTYDVEDAIREADIINLLR